MRKLKKLPLFMGLFLIVLWGAYKKSSLQIASTPPIAQVSPPSPFKDHKEDPSKETKIPSWDRFYTFFRPLLPAFVSDSDLKYFYAFIQDIAKKDNSRPITPTYKLVTILKLIESGYIDEDRVANDILYKIKGMMTQSNR